MPFDVPVAINSYKSEMQDTVQLARPTALAVACMQLLLCSCILQQAASTFLLWRIFLQ